MKVSRPHSGASARGISGARQTLRMALAVTVLGLTALSGCSRDQATVYAAYSKQMQERGRFRTETAPMDAPFTERDAARNLLLVAFELYQPAGVLARGGEKGLPERARRRATACEGVV